MNELTVFVGVEPKRQMNDFEWIINKRNKKNNFFLNLFIDRENRFSAQNYTQNSWKKIDLFLRKWSSYVYDLLAHKNASKQKNLH